MKKIKILPHEIKFSFIASPGPGGQNVNKVATAVLLRFNVAHTLSISQSIRQRLLLQLGKKLTSEGDILIKAHRYRTQEQNKRDAMERLIALINKASAPLKVRKKTMPSLASKERRLTNKKHQGKLKSMRKRESPEE